jgi:hypothetical protein
MAADFEAARLRVVMGDVGIWHEPYLIRAGDHESVHNMPSCGLGIAERLVPVQGRKMTAKGGSGRGEPRR